MRITCWPISSTDLKSPHSIGHYPLREQRSVPNRNRALTSRLPLWMKRRQNRADVLKGIARLKRLLD